VGSNVALIYFLLYAPFNADETGSAARTSVLFAKSAKVAQDYITINMYHNMQHLAALGVHKNIPSTNYL
jgi:hypothetical protein